jgi:hypothetical protein
VSSLHERRLRDGLRGLALGVVAAFAGRFQMFLRSLRDWWDAVAAGPVSFRPADWTWRLWGTWARLVPGVAPRTPQTRVR